jgi:transcriptional regulator with XRE-family HTH domain
MEAAAVSMTKTQRLGAALRRARMKYDVGLREMARHADVSATYISKIEHGQTVPSEKILRLYAAKFRIDFDEISRLAGRVPSDVQRHLVRTPDALKKVRKDMGKNGKKR